MTNKDKLKKAIEQDINSDSYYKEIISKIERGEKMKKTNNLWKWSLVPICLVVIISGVLFLNHQKNNKSLLDNKTFIDEKNNVTLNINEINNNEVGTTRLDADIKTITANDINIPYPFKGKITLPKDLDKSYNFIVYTRENKDSKDYNILNNYIIEYSNDNNNDRSIQVAYSRDYKPLRDYRFSDEGSKTTNINGVELKIYKFENIYFTEFTFNGYNFDIETFQITEQELSNFLLSILK